MTLDNLQYALYLNNRIILDRIKNLKDAIDNIINTDIDELKKLIEDINDTDLANINQLITDLDTDLSNHTSDTVIHVTQDDKDLWNATLQNAKDYAKKLFDSVTSFTIEIVDALPTEDIKSMTIYFMRNGRNNETDYYEEYMYINNKWEIIGSTFVNLTPYLLVSDFEKTINDYVTKADLIEKLKNYTNSIDLMNDYAKKTDLHNHSNKSVLDDLSDKKGVLNYKGVPIQTELTLSKEQNNAIIKKADGLFVKDESALIDSLQKQMTNIQQDINTIGGLIDSINRVVI